MSKAPREDIDESAIEVGHPKEWAVGIPGVMVSLKRGMEQMGPVRTVRTLRLLNQTQGYDCPGCAWPDPLGHRKPAEFCENGAKAVAEEATKRRVERDFFATHSLEELDSKTDYWLGQQGRLTEPMVRREGTSHYEPISWEDAFALVAEKLQALDSPDQAAFYTSGRTSNEAAFLYQLMVRAFGTNNLPDCSNMCHESSGAALSETIGIGKGSVTLEDIGKADLIVVVGQNPGTNHPRMLSALEEAKEGGAKIIAVNPLPEAGLMRFKNPQRPLKVFGEGTSLADEFCQIRLGGDLALFAAIGQLLLEADAVDHEFVEQYGHGFAEYAEHLRGLDWAAVERATGLELDQIRRVADLFARSERTIVCWAMGLTQHKHAVPTIREVMNVLLMRGMMGKPGAGACPVRGHSNVQGDRTMGVWEKMPDAFLDALEKRFEMPMPREHGFDTVDAIRAMNAGDVRVFFGVGGNFVAATPDTEATEKGLRDCDLTVQVSTKLNRSHAVAGRTALILPTLGRTERDRQEGGDQFVTVEDSMSMVHASRGRLAPASEQLRSEVAIVCGVARALFGAQHPIPWQRFEQDYDAIRDAIAAVVPGCADYNRRVRTKNGFVLPHPPRDSREFPTATGKANFTVNEFEAPSAPKGRLLLQTMRSHDQYNTTIYGLSDRYRGIENGRRVVFVNEKDLAELGLSNGEIVDLVSEWADGERRAERFRIVDYPTTEGCAAAYFPEANPLVPLESTAAASNTPTSKSIVVRLEPRN
ncbi:FdhF/YdeP family oxidoreductase [Sciscionella marina]|uniref:FdhF/YdeP family oxidoreductase n=1 Tax=Sciscionella marina TaxID=508770 RepID=UPI000375BCCC|nr:FdhF/YdeP family oxidoreductase [Sciscionella marina]